VTLAAALPCWPRPPSSDRHPEVRGEAAPRRATAPLVPQVRARLAPGPCILRGPRCARPPQDDG